MLDCVRLESVDGLLWYIIEPPDRHIVGVSHSSNMPGLEASSRINVWFLQKKMSYMPCVMHVSLSVGAAEYVCLQIFASLCHYMVISTYGLYLCMLNNRRTLDILISPVNYLNI